MTTLFDKVTDYKNIQLAYKQSQRGTHKYNKDSILFSMMHEYNLVSIWQQLKNKTYKPGKYIGFKVYEPKERMVHAPLTKDKIVQFALHNHIKDIYEKVYINDSYGCRENKGTHRAVKKVQHYMRLCKWKYGTGWIVKLDVSKFFYSIDRDILKKIVKKKIKCKDTLNLIYTIIDSSPEGDIGVPLGNITSQDFANIYLNELDQYCKRFLKVKWYVRYMDDVIITVRTKEEAQKLLSKIKMFLENKLHLNTNKKTQIFPISQGVNCYGYKIWTTHTLIRNDSKRRMKRKIKAMDKKKTERKMSKKDIIQSVNSWLGHARHSNSYNLCKRIFKKYDYIKIEGVMKFGNLSRNG